MKSSIKLILYRWFNQFLEKNMKLRVIFSIAILWLSSGAAHAFWLDSPTVEMPSAKNKISQTINNPDNSAHIMTVQVERIQDPYTMLPMQEEIAGEVLYSPSRAVVGSRKDSSVSFSYHGLEDDKERYYKIVWSDEAFTVSDSSASEKKTATVGSRSILSTVLVVHPRVENFKYELQKNILKNTGNSAFRFVAYGACQRNVKAPSDGICREVRYVMPKKSRAFTAVDIQAASAKLGIWHDGNHIIVK